MLAQIEALPDPRPQPFVPLPLLVVLTMCRFLQCHKSFRRVGEVLLKNQALLQRLGVAPVVCEHGYYRNGERKPFNEECFSEVFRLLVTNDQSIGGGTGRSLTALNVYSPADRQAYTYWVALAFMAVLIAISFVMLRGRLGASLQAIRDDEGAAESVGVPVARAKRIVFLLAAVGCGAAGAITMANTLTVTPASIFGVQWSAYMIFMVLLGGLGTFEGPVLGALVLFGIQQEFQDSGSWYLVGLGVVAIVVTLLLPRGIWGAVVDRFGIRLLPVGYTVRNLISGQRADTRAPS